MGSTAQQFGVPQFQGNHIKTLLLQEFYQRRLISIDHDQIRIDAECIHVDPIAADAFAADGVTQQPIVFVTNSDDDGYLFVNGQLVASDPGGHGMQDAFLGGTGGTPVQVMLLPGTYDFQQFHSEGGGGAGREGAGAAAADPAAPEDISG